MSVASDSCMPATQTAAAAAAKIPISAISFGTAYGQVDINGESQPVPTDDASIQRIADLSGGQSYDAGSAAQLSEVVNTSANRSVMKPNEPTLASPG